MGALRRQPSPSTPHPAPSRSAGPGGGSGIPGRGSPEVKGLEMAVGLEEEGKPPDSSLRAGEEVSPHPPPSPSPQPPCWVQKEAPASHSGRE